MRVAGTRKPLGLAVPAQFVLHCRAPSPTTWRRCSNWQQTLTRPLNASTTFSECVQTVAAACRALFQALPGRKGRRMTVAQTDSGFLYSPSRIWMVFLQVGWKPPRDINTPCSTGSKTRIHKGTLCQSTEAFRV